METLRHVTALEHLLGSLAPQITAMMSRALTLENKRKNTSNLMLEDSNAAGILELTKEKLAGQIVAGKLYSNFDTYFFSSFCVVSTHFCSAKPKLLFSHDLKAQMLLMISNICIWSYFALSNTKLGFHTPRAFRNYPF